MPLVSNLSPLQKTVLVWGVSLLLGLLFKWFFWEQTPGISILLYALLVLGVTALAVSFLEIVWPKSAWLVSGAIIFLAAMLTIRASSLLILLNLCTIFGLSLLGVWLLSGRTWQVLFGRFVALILLPVYWIQPFFKQLAQFGTTKRSEQTIVPVITGLIITIPIVVVLLVLFAQSSGLLAAFFNNIHIAINAELLVQIALVLLVTIWMAAALAFIRFDRRQQVIAPSVRRLGLTESKILLIGVNGAFALFVLSQVVYLFGGESYLASNAVTYAEYARRGFGELIAVTLIAAGIIWIAQPQLRDEKYMAPLGTLLAIQVLVVLASAMNKLWLYEQAYSFTLLRLVVHAFMIWLLASAVVILAQIQNWIKREYVGGVLVGLAVLTVIGINMLNPDRFVAQANIDRFGRTGKLDEQYLVELSTDALPVLLPFNKDNKQFEELTQSLSGSESHSRSWQSWNWSSWQAERLK